jgi:CRISPR-associated endonuclease/helicase Cas3
VGSRTGTTFFIRLKTIPAKTHIPTKEADVAIVEEVDLLEERLTGGMGLYLWQRRLLGEWLLQGRIPAAVDVPTGLGKTKAIAAWLIARASGSALPRRLVYVVDRRAVVDQATAEAQALASALREALADVAIDATMRNRWKENLGLGEDLDLPISTLRGQFVDNKRWIDRPYATSIVVGTVDMVGSRLLFSGYGVSRRMRPVHAGLLGCDTLMIIDEAHLVPPFETLLRQVSARTDRDREGCGGIPPRFSVMALSATGRTLSGATTFALNAADIADPPVRARISAEKRVRLLPQVTNAEIAKSLAERAWALSGETRRVLVFCNSRKIAQDVEAQLASRAKRRFGEFAALTELFVGERRLRERTLMYDPPAGTDRASMVLQRFFPDAEIVDRPAFLVATSAAEVGVDLDADDLVCDLVPWERMVQRFGRVNRRKVPGIAHIEIIPCVGEKDPDETAILSLADLSAPFESPEWPQAADGTRNASPLALQELKARIPALIERATSTAPYHPTLSHAVVEAWAMTTLHDHPGRPLVQPWLRGWDENPQPQCAIAWRRYLPIRASFRGDLNEAAAGDARSDIEQFLEAAPPHATELLQAPASRVAEWLRKRVEAVLAKPASPGNEPSTHHPIIVVLDGQYDLEDVYSLQRIARTSTKNLTRALAQRTLVIDARIGGLDESGLLDAKADEEPPTLDGDISVWGLALETYGQQRIRRGTWAPPEGDWRLQGFRWRENPENENEDELWVEIWRGADGTAGNAAITRRAQGLPEHHAWTRDEAKLIADGLSLSSQHAALLCAAAAAHDSGKNRELWQNAMNANASGRPFAKTTGGAKPGMLGGYRHEFGSLADAAKIDEIQALPVDDRDLALHLIAAHHGRSRPSIEPIDPAQAPSHSRALAQESTLRYMRLQRYWGAWGLAWWEVLLQSADWAASRRVNANE